MRELWYCNRTTQISIAVALSVSDAEAFCWDLCCRPFRDIQAAEEDAQSRSRGSDAEVCLTIAVLHTAHPWVR